jgi:hypothetical protein
MRKKRLYSEITSENKSGTESSNSNSQIEQPVSSDNEQTIKRRRIDRSGRAGLKRGKYKKKTHKDSGNVEPIGIMDEQQSPLLFSAPSFNQGFNGLITRPEEEMELDLLNLDNDAATINTIILSRAPSPSNLDIPPRYLGLKGG